MTSNVYEKSRLTLWLGGHVKSSDKYKGIYLIIHDNNGN